MIDWAEWSDQLDRVTDNQLEQAFWVAVALSLVLPRLPYGRNVLYPFALLATWAHELGHGVTALLAGGSFKRLVIYRNLDGLAYSSGIGTFGRAIVAAGGLLAPAVAGGAIIVLGAKESSAPWILSVLAGVVLLSVVLFVRNLYGWVALALIGLALIVTAVYAPQSVRVFVAQLIGIQFCFASWGSLDYMFTKNFRQTDGTLTDSDTQTIANALVLPYWFWGAVIAALSAAIVAGSFYVAWVNPPGT